MPPPTVSVALCTCNGAAYVAEQLRSILEQTRPVAEIVVRDDVSDDGTCDIVQDTWETHRQRKGAQLPHLRLIRNSRRLGVARNFEAALSDCTGDLIALSDQDDRWLPERLALLVARFEAHSKLLLLHGDARLVGDAGEELGGTLFHALRVTEAELHAIETGRGWQVLLNRNLVTGATAMLRRSLRDLALPIPDHWLHDEWLGMVAALAGGLSLDRRCLLDYRQHAANQIGASRAALSDLVRRALAERGDWHRERMLRARELAQRSLGLAVPLPPGAAAAISDKLRHHTVRAELPAKRLARVVLVWSEWRTGRYGRYGRGLQGVLRDLLQPAERS